MTDKDPALDSRPMYRLWVNDDHTLLVRLWEDDTVEVATRETPDYTWGPPATLTEVKTR